MEREPLLRYHKAASVVSKGQQTKPPAWGSVNKVSRGDLIWILTGLWSAVFLSALDGTVVATLISPIGSHFQQSHKSSYLGTSYLLSVCCFTPLYGRLSDILGRKGAMLLALTFFTFGTVFCGLASSMNMLILARAIAGIGGGGLQTVSSIALTDLIPLKQRALYQGLSNILFGLGSGLGGALGGLINDTFGWRWAFLLQTPLLLFSMIVVALKVNIELPFDVESESTYDKLRRLDWVGSLTLVLGVGSLLLGMNLKTTEDIPWSHPMIWTLFVASFVSLALFVAVEARWSVEPVLPMKLMMQRTPMAVSMANFFVIMATSSMLYNVPLYFSAVRLTSSAEAGLHLLPNAVMLAVGSIFSGWVIRRTGRLYNMLIGTAALTVISCLYVSMWNHDTSAFHLWFDMLPNGMGGSSVMTTVLIALIASVPREDMAVATGISYLFRMSGQALGVSLSGALVQGVLTNQLRKKITGPGSYEIIQRIRHETDLIATLDPPLRQAAIDSYATALKVVFRCQTVVAVCTLLSCLCIEEYPLSGSHEEQDEQDRRKRENQMTRNQNGTAA